MFRREGFYVSLSEFLFDLFLGYNTALQIKPTARRSAQTLKISLSGGIGRQVVRDIYFIDIFEKILGGLSKIS